ncbi:hypothetical protein [Thermocrispum municipale]|jgi:uncharacterized membrane protein YgcG|uniref:hypothetical protein n=1 Tax=Thermocrispum municipale TaxID=37926 RepID=UPI00040E5F57|nr:hypothetical protein [Thermocrispum municipale]
MGEAGLLIIVLVVVVLGGFYLANQRSTQRRTEIEDAKAEARRWVERLGGQVLNLTGTNEASKQAIADASERYTAAGSQLEQAQTAHQARLVIDTALEGLYYVRAARTAMGLDPGPELPQDRERERAGAVTEHRSVDVEGKHYEASPEPDDRTPYYYPGGRVAGRAVPRGWYSEPWWKPALVAGAWGFGSMMLFSAMFSGMAGVASPAAWEAGAMSDADMAGGDMGDAGGDMGGDMGDAGGDFGGGDFGGGDWGGGFGDFGDFGGF